MMLTILSEGFRTGELYVIACGVNVGYSVLHEHEIGDIRHYDEQQLTMRREAKNIQREDRAAKREQRAARRIGRIGE